MRKVERLISSEISIKVSYYKLSKKLVFSTNSPHKVLSNFTVKYKQRRELINTLNLLTTTSPKKYRSSVVKWYVWGDLLISIYKHGKINFITADDLARTQT